VRTIKGPAIFLAQFVSDEAPFNTLDSIAKWAADLGFKGLQIPTWDERLIDLAQAADSRAYCDDLRATLDKHGLEPTELSTHLQGQLVAVHPAYDTLFDAFAAPHVRGKPDARQRWAVDQLLLAARASANLGLTEHATFSGALAWPYLYPWPQRPAGLVETAFDELANLPAKICTTASHSKCFLSGLIIIRAAICCMTLATTFCRHLTMSTTSTSITSASRCSMSRMLN